MTDRPLRETIKAGRETIWHLTCPACKYYWTYPTMQDVETLAGRELHCPLCGVKSAVEVTDAP